MQETLMCTSLEVNESRLNQLFAIGRHQNICTLCINPGILFETHDTTFMRTREIGDGLRPEPFRLPWTFNRPREDS